MATRRMMMQHDIGAVPAAASSSGETWLVYLHSLQYVARNTPMIKACREDREHCRGGAQLGVRPGHERGQEMLAMRKSLKPHRTTRQ